MSKPSVVGAEDELMEIKSPCELLLTLRFLTALGLW